MFAFHLYTKTIKSTFYLSTLFKRTYSSSPLLLSSTSSSLTESSSCESSSESSVMVLHSRNNIYLYNITLFDAFLCIYDVMLIFLG